MTEKRFVPIGVEWTDGFIQDHIGDKDLFNVGAVCNLLNELHEENMMLRGKHTQLIILLKDIVDDLKRMDTKGYAKHIEKIGNIKFLGMEDLE